MPDLILIRILAISVMNWFQFVNVKRPALYVYTVCVSFGQGLVGEDGERLSSVEMFSECILR